MGRVGRTRTNGGKHRHACLTTVAGMAARGFYECEQPQGGGVFSGSFWWRKKAYEEGYNEDNDRIMHELVREGHFNKGQKFWFECGTDDEKDDRNNNGIIDSIDDTNDLIIELQKKGYIYNQDIVYYEINGGQHNQVTWSKAFPVFLKWLLGR